MEETTEPTKIMIGDTEYDQDSLEKLVQKASQVEELEGKWNTKIDRLMPEYTKATQERAELQKRIDEMTQQQVANKPEEELTQDEIRMRALEEADKLGLLTKSNVRDEVLAVLQARDLVDNIKEIMRKAGEEGKPTATVDEFLEYMQDPANPKDPQKAYKLMFEKELDELKTKQMAEIRPEGFSTIESSTAGSKQPVPDKITSENLRSTLSEFLRQ